jgi:hypothetical protein
MNKKITISLISGIALGYAAWAETVRVNKPKAKVIVQKVCPVMGGKINKKLYYEYKKQKIYVCCQGCIGIIQKNPDKYLKKVQAAITAAKKQKKVMGEKAPKFKP